jgi:arsenite transporter
MLGIATLFLGVIFKDLLPGTEVVKDGTRSNFTAPTSPGPSCLASRPAPRWCWSGVILAKGNQGHTLVMVAINSLTMLFLYGLLGGWLARA